ncbi:MAG TPA: hypothetical protein DCS07_05560 [Bdellovibrionales bacterium]|nr:MAG: hypothetical protein A2Z97_13310 [Bdellovibrionales bacterium GWB1_52_6]OFZ05809.1 MAG: hypothetical protein A2X97_03855 [Bdellovibrionales bacterium GWA1_52_35]OFZ33750.1 MAG: hypothetical protein A2070_08250 [Bdellovibrionales bacterium GWC1_52_8]HAR42086.1 hypothetical protein [Bdellovibrionales bacterium]HCM40249.1 hypothetical protein [Bdellovibrionales bacterium]
MKTKPSIYPLVSGPARSRRFGLSLNLNFGPAGESCLWNCIYCPWHNAKTKPKKASIPKQNWESYLATVTSALKKEPKIETVILGGNSELTLYPDLPNLVSALLKLKKSSKAKWKLIALSNGSGLQDKKIRTSCEKVDQLWLKLDCAEDPLFKKAIRPKSRNAEFKFLLNTIRELKGVRIQTAFWKIPGKEMNQNWSADNLKALLKLYAEIRPLEIHLTTLKRNRSSAGAQPVTFEEMEAFALRTAELGINTEVFP